jgi:hypothetical protein
MDMVAWLVLRVVFAWLFLMPLPGLLKDFKGSMQLTRLLVPVMTPLFTVVMLLIMFVGSLSVLFGFYAQIGGLLLALYSLGGSVVHEKLAKQCQSAVLSGDASDADNTVLSNTGCLGFVGHHSSAQKNIVLAGVGIFFLLMGSGPLSLTGTLF